MWVLSSCASPSAPALVLCALAAGGAKFPVVMAIENGLGLTPPMGWRSWNLYGGNVKQSLMQRTMDGMVSRKRLVDGVPTSLADLGYVDVGLDDNWQLCGQYGDQNYTYHASGGVYPVVNRDRFPDLLAMTNYAHSLNLTAGWYLNNCICADTCGSGDVDGESDETCYRGDVAAFFSYGFDGVKLDHCGRQQSLDLWASLLNASATTGPVLIENCHAGLVVPNATWCPFNVYRTSTDVHASYASILANLNSTHEFAVQNLSYPGCWGYPDMLEVGVGDLTFEETRSHFAAWAVVSSPLTLSMDVNDDDVMDAVWDLIANPEIIAVNQAWFGHSGSRFLEAAEEENSRVSLGGIPPRRHFSAVDDVDAPAWQYLYKPINATATAVLMLNSLNTTANLTLAFDDVPAFVDTSSGTTDTVAVRDLFARQDLGEFASSSAMTLELAAHDAAFLLLTTALGPSLELPRPALAATTSV